MSGHQAIRFARFAKKNKFDGLDADIWADWMPSFCPNCGAPMTDEAAQERLTERGELLPCPKCKGVGTLHSVNGLKSIYASCYWCGMMTRGFETANEAIKNWNDRAPILSAEEFMILEEIL